MKRVFLVFFAVMFLLQSPGRLYAQLPEISPPSLGPESKKESVAPPKLPKKGAPIEIYRSSIQQILVEVDPSGSPGKNPVLLIINCSGIFYTYPVEGGSTAENLESALALSSSLREAKKIVLTQSNSSGQGQLMVQGFQLYVFDDE